MIAFAHLSDTHFGAELANHGRGLVWGQRPHHAVKCLALPAALNAACFLMDAPCEGNALPLVISGDLTVSGAATEQAVAHAFLRGRFPTAQLPGPDFEMGLGQRADRWLQAVPGNHDHWGGARVTMPAHTADITPLYFRTTPWREALTSPDGTLALELAGIDSNSGWAQGIGQPPLSRVHGMLARGHIAKSQLDLLQAWFTQGPAAKADRVVRAVVCHHSLSHRGSVAAMSELDDAPRRALLKLCGEHAVSAVLTGHTHDALCHRHTVADAQGRAVACAELRSAHSVGFGKRGASEPAEEVGFLTHRIAPQSDGALRWDTWRWVWNGSRYKPDPLTPWHSFTARAV